MTGGFLVRHAPGDWYGVFWAPSGEGGVRSLPNSANRASSARPWERPFLPYESPGDWMSENSNMAPPADMAASSWLDLLATSGPPDASSRVRYQPRTAGEPALRAHIEWWTEPNVPPPSISPRPPEAGTA
jgi:hypothetical protein